MSFEFFICMKNHLSNKILININYMQSSDTLQTLISLAQGIIAKKGDPSYSSIASGANYNAFGITYEDSPGLVNWAHYDGITVEKFKLFFENYA